MHTVSNSPAAPGGALVVDGDRALIHPGARLLQRVTAGSWPFGLALSVAETTGDMWFERHALRVAASFDGIWEWDLAAGEVWYSERFAELLGYARDEIPDDLAFFRGLVHPEDAHRSWAAVRDHLDRSSPYDIEVRLRTRGDEYRWFRARGLAQRDVQGQATWMAGAIQDITDRKAAENQLRDALEEVRRLKDRLSEENTYLREEINGAHDFHEIVGQSQSLRRVLRSVDQVAQTDANVLLLGETGTGKELFARAIHNRSPRRTRPLVKVNCAALPASLIESELFGHMRGAFTGALNDKVGRFELADGGTLFLDEIGDLEPALQTKLLRVLQEGEFERIGSNQTIRSDVRVIAATNRDLQAAIADGTFRSDLFYRLAVFPVAIPPLRERRDDIPLLAWHFIATKQTRLARNIQRVPARVMNALTDYDWPGNVRELENVVERAMILSSGPELELSEVLASPRQPRLPTAPPPSASVASETLEGVEREHLVRVLSDCRWKIKGPGHAADRLGLSPSTLRFRMKKLGIERPDREADGREGDALARS